MASKTVERADWRDSRTVKFFLDVCIAQINTFGKKGNSLKKESWSNVINEFEEKKGLKFTQKQLKNQWNYMRQKYVTWSNLVRKSGDNYDPVTHTVTWSQEEWDNYIQRFPEAKQFRYAGLQHADEMATIFDGMIAISNGARDPSRDELSIESPMPIREVRDSWEEPVEFQSGNVRCASFSSHSTESDTNLRPKKRRKRSKIDDIDRLIMAILSALEKYDGPKIQECNDKLSKMSLLQDGDKEYIAACAIFCEGKSYREQWLQLCNKPEEIRIGWIRMVGKKLGLL